MELDAVLRERRSMRKYQPDRKVSREQVKEILKAATLAPSWKKFPDSQILCGYVR